MAKAVLVIDMPDDVSLDEWFAKIHVDRLKIPVEEMMKGIPFDESKMFNFVHLRPLPGKDNKAKASSGAYTRGYSKGWNACLDEITGETDKEKLDDNVDIVRKWARYCVCGTRMVATETGGWYCPSCHKTMKSILVKRVG